MFLKANRRIKDGKAHYYWTLVESVRAGRRVFQRQALYLGELNDSQRAEWQRAIEAFDEKGRARQLKLFPAERAPADGGADVVKVRMDKVAVRNLRNWGEVWLGLELWKRLGLDEFWAPRLEPGRKGTDWLAILKSIVMYRLTAPGSELRMHSSWLAETAVAELFGTGALTGRSTLYNCLDRVLWPFEERKKPRGERRNSFKDDLFHYLRGRWAGMFGSTCDVVLFDLTSTYFEVDGTKALDSVLQRHGYSRDKRPDCLQVVVALVLTPDGFPLAYEVLPGNTSDKGTQMAFVRKLEAKYGRWMPAGDGDGGEAKQWGESPGKEETCPRNAGIADRRPMEAVPTVRRESTSTGMTKTTASSAGRPPTAPAPTVHTGSTATGRAASASGADRLRWAAATTARRGGMSTRGQ